MGGWKKDEMNGWIYKGNKNFVTFTLFCMRLLETDLATDFENSIMSHAIG